MVFLAEILTMQVAIGFSIMAYRLQGLRSSDLLLLITALQAEESVKLSFLNFTQYFNVVI